MGEKKSVLSAERIKPEECKEGERTVRHTFHYSAITGANKAFLR